MATSLTVAAAARRLGVDPSRVRQRLAARTLYGFKLSSGWRVPIFQFDGDRLLPNVEQVLPHLRPDLHPLAVFTWFTLPNPDLVEGPDEVPVSPRDWLRLGRDPTIVAALARDL